MKSFIASLLILSVFVSTTFAQSNESKKSDFKLFNRTSIGYTFGLNETLGNKKANALHLKTVMGYSLPQVGFGIGLETTTFNTSGSGNNSRFNTIAFTGNLYVLAKPITEESLNLFIKGALGYAPRVFSTYEKGLTYEGATGVIITSKKKNRYFIEAIYHHQQLSRIIVAKGKLEIKSLGFGIGTWF